MNILYVIIIAFACAVGGWFGGSITTGIHDQKLPPKTNIQNINTVQNVETKTSSVQESDQSQTTIILQTDRTNYKFVHIQGQGKTNATYFFQSKTNTKKTTNR